MASFALAAIGRDAPGIVAIVSSALFDKGCNIEDSSMTLLRGNFAMMLVFTAPDDATAASLEAALDEPCRGLGMTFSVLPVDDRVRPPHPSHVCTVYGADKPGILARMSAALAGADGNITGLTSRIIGDAQPVYVLQIEVELGGPTAELERRLDEVASAVGVEVSFAPYDADVL